jgi:hypothetical protein
MRTKTKKIQKYGKIEPKEDRQKKRNKEEKIRKISMNKDKE